MLKLGNGFGPALVVCRLRGGIPDATPALAGLAGLPGAIALRLMAVDHGATGLPSTEKTMRQGAEGAFDHLLCIEAPGDAAAAAIAARLPDLLPAAFPGLADSDISVRRMIYAEAPHEGPTGP